MEELKELSREDLLRVVDHQQRQMGVLVDTNKLMAEKLGIDPTAVDLQVEGLESAPDGSLLVNLQPSASLNFFAETIVRNFRDSGAKNYFTIGVQDPEGKERYEVTLQKVSGETPTFQNARLRAEIEELQRQLDDARQGN